MCVYINIYIYICIYYVCVCIYCLCLCPCNKTKQNLVWTKPLRWTKVQTDVVGLAGLQLRRQCPHEHAQALHHLLHLQGPNANVHRCRRRCRHHHQGHQGCQSRHACEGHLGHKSKPLTSLELPCGGARGRPATTTH